VRSSETSLFTVTQLVAGGKLVNVGLLGGELQVLLQILSVKQLTVSSSSVGSLVEMGELMEYVRAGVRAGKVKTTEAFPIADVQHSYGSIAGREGERSVVLRIPAPGQP
jgi:alcohol dehydrogenase, propanol-preferring